jgi:hypothetical protein
MAKTDQGQAPFGALNIPVTDSGGIRQDQKVHRTYTSMQLIKKHWPMGVLILVILFTLWWYNGKR